MPLCGAQTPRGAPVRAKRPLCLFQWSGEVGEGVIDLRGKIDLRGECGRRDEG